MVILNIHKLTPYRKFSSFRINNYFSSLDKHQHSSRKKIESRIFQGIPYQLWNDLPLLNFVFYAAIFTYAEIVSLVPPRPEYIWSFIFPLIIPLIIYSLRWKKANTNERWLYLIILSSAPLLIGLTWWFAIRIPIAPHTLRHIYEIGAIMNLLVLIIHAAKLQRELVWLLLGPIALYGLLLENGGIALGFFSELNYYFYLVFLPAPLAPLCGWMTIFYLVIWVNWEIQKYAPRVVANPYLAATFAAFSGLMLDLQIDPLATAVGFWVWNPLLQTKVLGVPILNFIAWFCAIYPFIWLISRREQMLSLAALEISEKSHRHWLLLRIPLVLAVAAVMFCSMMLLIEGGLSGPTFAILRQSAINFGVFPLR